LKVFNLGKREIQVMNIGMKITCQKCSQRFYDLNKTPAMCPICGSKNARPAAPRRTDAREPRHVLSVFKARPSKHIPEIPDNNAAPEVDSELEDTSVLDDRDNGTTKEAGNGK
jgi:hypothetical protein